MKINPGDGVSLTPIPADDILDAYCASSRERRQAVSNILRSRGYLVSSVISEDSDARQKSLLVDWATDPEMSLMTVASLIAVGEKRFGEAWKQALTEMAFQKE